MTSTTRRVPHLPPEIPRRGGALTGAIGRGLLACARWRIEGTPPPLRKMVMILGPHTSAWDLVVALASMMALRLEASFFAKHTLFAGPLGVVLRAFGGIPVDRTARHNVVEQMARQFEERETLILGLAPEGTRRQVGEWKTGFYHIAEAAGVPIVPVALDFGRRTVRIGPALTPGDDPAAEIATLRSFLETAIAKRPDLV